MRNRGRLGEWLRARWLELILLVGFIGVLAWFTTLGLGFVPKVEPTPAPAPTPTLTPTETPTLARGQKFDGRAA